MRKLLSSFIVLTLAALPVYTSASTTFKCKNKFVHTGDTMAKVLSVCGNPHNQVDSASSKSRRQTLVYPRTGGQFFGLHFRNGKLFKIENLGK